MAVLREYNGQSEESTGDLAFQQRIFEAHDEVRKSPLIAGTLLEMFLVIKEQRQKIT